MSMKKYQGLTLLLEEILKEFNYEFLPQNGNNGFYTQVIIRNYAEGVILVWDIENSLMFSEEINSTVAEKLKTLFYNRVFFETGSKIDSISFVDNFIDNAIKFKSPESRVLSVLDYVYRHTPFAGDTINIDFPYFKLKEQYWRKMFFHTADEFLFYIKSAERMGYLQISAEHQQGVAGVGLTVEGLKTIINIEKENQSNSCFVAMSFDEDMFAIYKQAIMPAIVETGFEPLIISDKKDIPSDMTINDAILAAIKKSKFTVSDFTRHKHGVYFESGYALGLGQKVIYTCKVDEIGKAHFDTRNYPHIVWKNSEDLKQQLIDKIEVFIKG